MSVVSDFGGRVARRRPVAVELGGIAVMWVRLFAAAYSLGSGSPSGAQAGVPASQLATGSPVTAGTATAPSTPAKHVSIVTLAGVPSAPALKLAPKPKAKPRVTVVVSRPVVVPPVVVSSPTTVAEQPPPVVVTPPPSTGGSKSTSTGSSHSSGSSSQSGSGTVSGGG